MDESLTPSGPRGPHTFFAPAGRQDPGELEKLSKFTLDDPIVQTVLESVGAIVLVLNRQRQILAVNEEVFEALHRDQQSYFQGLRPGEAFGCQSVKDGPDGCGTSSACRYCGAVITVLISKEKRETTTGECLMTMLRDSQIVAGEFHVRAMPICIKNEWLTVLVMRDISAEKRRSALERIFLHDFNNMLTGLVGLSQLAMANPGTQMFEEVADVVQILSREIHSQRLLLEAEQGGLRVDLHEVAVSHIFRELEGLFSVRMLHLGRQIAMETRGPDVVLLTDKRLLLRVLTNMIKNAVEATAHGNPIRVWFKLENGAPEFVVWNREAMDEKTSAQIFKRSFSTKGELGRGLGTYSMKLLGEHYLKGKIWFTSGKEEGTTFRFSLPPDSVL